MFSPIDLTFQASRTGRRWQSLVGALALIAVITADLPSFTRVLLVAVVVLWFVYSRFYLPLIPVERLWWQLRKGPMRIQQSGCWLDVERIESVLVTRQVIFMRLHLRQRYLPVAWTLWRDSLDENDYRRMSVAVRFGKPPQFSGDETDSQNR